MDVKPQKRERDGKMNERMAKASVGKLLLEYSIPGIIGMMVTALYNVVDRIFIGKIEGIGSQAIAGVGVTMPMTTVIMAFGMLIGMGATAHISIHLGKKDPKTASRILGNAFSLSIIISVLLTIIGVVFCDDILMMFGASPEILPYAKDYIIIILYGTIFNILGFAVNNTIRADGSPMIAGLTMIVGCAVNIILDPIFIFVFDMGIQGAAVATVISQAVSALLILWYYFGGKSNMKVTLKSFTPNLKYIAMIFAIGLSPFSMQIASSVVQVIINNQLKSYGGDTAIGAFTIITSISMLFMMPIFGINQGAQPIMGYNYGAKNYSRVKKALYLVTIVSTIYLIVGCIIVQSFPEFLIRMFNNDPALVTMATKGMRIMLITMPILGVCVVGPSFFQNIGKPKISLLLSLLRQVILLIPALLVIPRFLELTGVWISTPIADVFSFVIVTICVVREIRKYKSFDEEFDEDNTKSEVTVQ